ncbi:unnamed protein product [Closterium sp. Yama58-4]|nr:unnamed protein product [Closterium sp. Yama58-4]
MDPSSPPHSPHSTPPPSFPLSPSLSPPQEFEEIFATMDRNGDGSIDFEEYVAVMSGYMGEQNMQQDLIAMYQLFSDKRTGKISQRTLKRGVLALGIVFSDDEIRGMFNSADVDGMFHSADVDGMLHSADVDGMFHSADVDGMLHSADVDGMFHSADVDAIQCGHGWYAML